MKKELKIELIPKEKVKLIIKSINDAKLQYKNYVKNERLATENGKYLTIWNYIFTNIKESFKEIPYKCYKISRGNLWDFIAIYDQKNQILYVVMKEKTFERIKKSKDKDYHYIKILNAANPIKKGKYKQTSLFQEDKEKAEYIKNDFEQMLKDIDGKVKLCIDILFSEKENKVVSISGNIFDYDLDTIKSYSWNKFIEADIDEIADTNSNDDEDKTPDIELNVRKHVEKQKENTKDIIASKEKPKKKSE